MNEKQSFSPQTLPCVIPRLAEALSDPLWQLQ